MVAVEIRRWKGAEDGEGGEKKQVGNRKRTDSSLSSLSLYANQLGDTK